MSKANTGILQNAQPLNWKQIEQLENQILANGGSAFFIEPGGYIRLITNKLAFQDVKDIALHKISILNCSSNNKELKQEYLKNKFNNQWKLDKQYIRDAGDTNWQLIVTKDNALLGKALLGKMILGRRY
jgi:hypothetical protein